MDYEEIRIRKKIEEAKKTKYCAKQQMAQADIQIGEFDLQLLELNKNKEEKIAEEKPETYRKYSDSSMENAPVIVSVNKKGNLTLKTQKTKTYNIYTLLKLKQLIPDTTKYKSFQNLADAVGISEVTCHRLCTGIELGFYDEIFEKWESIQQNPLKYDETGQLII